MVPMMRKAVCKLAVVLATGYILFFFSERVFWSFWRTGDNLGDFLLTWFVYSLLGWVFLLVVRQFRVASFAPLFLAGAVFGWLGEGLVVDTLYGGAENPFPLSVSFTGLAWHALLSVGVGWYWFGRALADERPARIILVSIVTGVGWGLWAVWWPSEMGVRAGMSVRGFAAHALTCTMPLLASWALLGMARPEWFRPGLAEKVVLSGLVLLFFLGVRVPATPRSAIVLPPLLLLCAVGLRRNARIEGRPDLLDDILGRVRLRHVPILLLMPAAAILTYAPFHLLDLRVPTNVILYVVTMPLGFWLLIQSVWRIFRQAAMERARCSRASPPMPKHWRPTGPLVAQLVEGPEQAGDVEGAAIEGLDVMVPARLVVVHVGAVDRDGPEPGHGPLQQRPVVRATGPPAASGRG